ncbi:hypothetical protein HGH93_00210 [Chitinophaga polysaccharea]|uniref:hypothetical protein n=1 Tax=Chitinophaga polysaccharea TaxID=1293035 RepID=UPI001455DAFD|nr:hypothetical protein [Chitinophaga polysaccharea]NLR56502.1 hypothetical protein [Chitinophaga polysaccharea]
MKSSFICSVYISAVKLTTNERKAESKKQKAIIASRKRKAKSHCGEDLSEYWPTNLPENLLDKGFLLFAFRFFAPKNSHSIVSHPMWKIFLHNMCE